MAQAPQIQIEVFPIEPTNLTHRHRDYGGGQGYAAQIETSKVLHEIGGKPILAHVIATAVKVVPAQNVFVIVGHEAERVREAVRATGVNFVLQAEQRGTGHALMAAREALSGMTRCLCFPATLL